MFDYLRLNKKMFLVFGHYSSPEQEKAVLIEGFATNPRSKRIVTNNSAQLLYRSINNCVFFFLAFVSLDKCSWFASCSANYTREPARNG